MLLIGPEPLESACSYSTLSARSVTYCPPGRMGGASHPKTPVSRNFTRPHPTDRLKPIWFPDLQVSHSDQGALVLKSSIPEHMSVMVETLRDCISWK
ncbi:hypothetical protein EYF80_056612 [Liparis tanakae]|uniref:Uncharacterized protein n=1 Tax=Liparis tanakae TaxID=230148 RepID=A0A4Z2EW96_9TELE|nr:hypothetical protein EYF80_056612 [Liparis tanakae]